MTRPGWIAFLVCILAAGMSAGPARSQEPVSFTRQIAPILIKNCLVCHGPKEAKGEYQVQTFELLQKPGATGEMPIVAGMPDKSDLMARLISDDEDLRMPKDGEKLPQAQLDLVRRWITEGAKFDSPDPKAALSAIAPKEPHPDPPAAYPIPVPITAVAFHPSGAELAAGGYHEVTIWSPADGQLLRRIKNVAQRTYGLAYHSSGSLLAVAAGTPGQLGEIKLFNPADGTLVKDLATLTECAFGVAFNPAGDKLAACGGDRTVRIFDVASGKQERVIEDHADWVLGVAWNNDGTKLATASRDKTSKVFNAQTGEALATFNAHQNTVNSVAFSTGGDQVLSAGADNQIRVWNPADGKPIAAIGGFGGEVFQVSVSEGQIVSCSADKTARQHDGGNRNQVRSYAGQKDWSFTVAYHGGTKRLAAGGYSGEVVVYNTEDGNPVVTIVAAPGYMPPAAASP